MLLIILLIIILFFIWISESKEGFNDHSGQLCTTCNGRTFNQCLQCFNCGFCVDKWGNSTCVGGDRFGPYNFEKCDYYYYIDPYYRMMENNKFEKCSDGPRSANRVIGV